MTARRTAVAVAAVCSALVGLLAIAGVQALAVTEHVFSGQFGSEGAGNGQLSSPAGVAVEEAGGDVYVVDGGNNRVEVFEANGTYVSQFGGSGTPAGSLSSPTAIAIDNSKSSLDPSAGDVYVVDAGHNVVDKFTSAGAYIGQLIEGEAGSAFGSLYGVGVDQNGGVWVYQESKEVDAFTNALSNAFVSKRESPFGTASGFAVDSEDNLYVNRGAQVVAKLNNAGEALIEEVDGETTSAAAVDLATNKVYLDNLTTVGAFAAAGTFVERFGSGHLASGTGIAVDSSTNELYVADAAASNVETYSFVTVPDVTTGTASNVTTTTATLAGSVNPDGVAVTACQFEYGTEASYGHTAPCASNPGSGGLPVEVTANVTGLAPNTHYHFRLSASNANGSNYGQDAKLLTLSPPLIDREFAETVGITTATLDAQISPLLSDTTYHFEYGTDASYGASIPVPDADIGAGASANPEDPANRISVAQRIAGLQAGMTYHYRVVATNANGTTDGPDKVLVTSSTVREQLDSCPNAAFRVGGLSEGLPDCRAYELVSPVDKNGGDVSGLGNSTVAADSGNGVTFASLNGFGDDVIGSGGFGSVQYVASRGPSGWSTHAVTPTPSLNSLQIFITDTENLTFSGELDRSVLNGFELPGASVGIPNAKNLYLEDIATRRLETLTQPVGSQEVKLPLNTAVFGRPLRGSSSDLGVVTFETTANLLPEATGRNPKLYVVDHGTLGLAGILNDGSIPASGSTSARRGDEAVAHKDTVSSDGSRIFFMSPADGSATPQLYMRKDVTSTVWVSQSEASSPNPEPQSVKFQAASPDGTKVLFTSADRLLDVDPGGAGYGLYLFTDSAHPETDSNLTFIARISGQGEPNTVTDDQEAVLGISDDGTHVYFQSEAESGLPPTTDRGALTLYLWDRGVVRQVAPDPAVANSADQFQTIGDTGGPPEPQVSADGRRIAFASKERLTGQETGVDQRGQSLTAMYLYDEPSNTLTCVSCPQSGAAMTSSVELGPEASDGVAVGIPYLRRYLSSDGRYLLFNTADALVPQDVNKLTDVYEYDVDTRKVSLISSGTGEAGSWLADMSPSGHDVFFVTRQQLNGWDKDKLIDLYDARVGGGLAEPPVPPVPCSGDACQGTPSAPPTFNTASGFNGLGNASVTKNAKPQKRGKHGKRPKRKRNRHKRKAGKSGRRTSHGTGR